MVYKPERIAEIRIAQAELLSAFDITTMIDGGEAVTLDAMIATFTEAKQAAEKVGYSNVSILIEAEEIYSAPCLSWELRGSRMETPREVEAREDRDELKRERGAQKEVRERDLFKKLRAKYGDES